MPYAICRVTKLGTWGNVGGSAAHTYRTIPTPNASQARAALNRTLVGTKGDVVGDVRARVNAVTDRPRKNAVLCVEHLLTASPEWFEGKSEEDLAAWAKRNVTWLQERYGEANVVHVVLHRDETSPHLVAYVVPEVDGRLNARNLVGGRAQLAQLQTSYAGAMETFGLSRGIPGSKAKHQDVKRFYGQANTVGERAAAAVRLLSEPSPPPAVPFWKGQEARTEATEAWREAERGRTRKLATHAASAVLAATTAKQRVEDLTETNAMLHAETDRLRADLARAYEALALSKDDVAALRKSDTSLVAQRLGHMGEVGAKENAIDLCKRVGGFTYEEAVAWLHAELGAVVTGALVAKSVEAAAPPRPFTTAENSIKAAVLKQTAALGCDKYRITLVPQRDGAKPYLPGKPGGSKQAEPERFYSRNDLVALIPWLRYENNQGKNVFITPMDDNAFYVLLDDARISAEELERQGFQPCLVQRTSWEKHQMVFKVPKDLPREAVLEVFNRMNKAMGDEEMTGLRHPFRLAGLRNMWPKHEREGQRPFVTVTMAVQRFCERCTAMVRAVAARNQPSPTDPLLPLP